MPKQDDCPTEPSERIESLDALRGLALFGVLMVNLQTMFRVPLFAFFSSRHTRPGYANLAVDDAIQFVLEFKAFAILSFLFGIGLAIFFERTGSQGRGRPMRLLLRRLLVLLSLGSLHMLFWNGDVLLAYAVAGLLVSPVLFAGPRLAVGLALACAAIEILPLSLPGLPAHATMLRQGVAATAVYGGGSFGEAFRFRWNETRLYIAPLLLGSLPRIAGLMLAGTAVWRLGLISNPRRHLALYRAVALAGLATGGGASALELLEQGGRLHLGVLARLVFSLAIFPFAFGYVALFLWAVAKGHCARLVRIFAPIGRMAFTSYVTQSLVLGLVFYGYGLGLCGRLPSAPVALGGIAFYSFQIGASHLWLSRFRFGPLEWIWRSLTFGSAQALRLAPVVSARRDRPEPGGH